MSAPSPKTIVIAGASGFVGRALGRALHAAGGARVVGLSRSPHSPGDGFDEWRAADLFSLRDAERALEGAAVAVYLVHSMMPSAALSQGRFEDLDLICADNFARAAQKAGVSRILYLGGLVPDGSLELSAHLASRLEVERALGGYGVPVTTLRAGLVVGPGGSSFDMLLKLVERLPAMICPSWTATRTQPIALVDVVALLAYAVEHPATAGKIYDVGGPEVMTYREMMRTTAEVLGVTRRFVTVPLFTPQLSTLWVTLVTGASRELVAPLVESLRHEMVARERTLQEEAGLPGMPFREALAVAIAERTPGGAARAPRPPADLVAGPRRVRSVQRLPLPPGRDATWVSEEYLRWLARAFRPLLHVELSPGAERARICFRGLSLLELTHSRERSAPDRPLLYITGGALSRDDGRGRLELREVRGAGVLLAAIHDFIPRLPWFLYRRTQAIVHLAVMWRFGVHLARAGVPDRGLAAALAGARKSA